MLESKVGTFAEVAFLESVASGSFELVNLAQSDAARIAELVAGYDDLPLGTTDASVIALAERLGVDEIATLDHRHFRVVRPSHVQTLALVHGESRKRGGPCVRVTAHRRALRGQSRRP